MNDFKYWLSKNGDLFWEMTNLKTADTSHIVLEPTGSDFDRSSVEDDCRRKVERYFDTSSYYEDIYEDPEDDPDFDGVTVEKWDEDNPEPDDKDYEDKEEFDSDHEKWMQEREEAEEEYEKEVRKWERNKERKEQTAEEEANNDMQEEIEDCIDEEERDHVEEKGFIHKFEHDGKSFNVHLDSKKINYAGQSINNVYTVLFEGPEGYSTTGASGTEATTIYSKLVLAIKKLTEDHEVNGLSFTPAEPGMRIIYTRFYNSFMKDNFVRVKSDLYVKRDIVRKALEVARKQPSSEQSRKILSGIVDAHRQNRSLVDNARILKKEKRSASVIGSHLIGQFVPEYKNNFPALILDFDKNTGVFMVIHKTIIGTSQGLTTEKIDFEKLALPFSKLQPNDIHGNFVEKIASFNYEDQDAFPLYSIGKSSNLITSPPNVSNFQENIKKFIEEFKVKYNNSQNKNYLGQTYAEYLHITYPRGMQALENYASKIGIEIKDPDVQTGAVTATSGASGVGGASGAVTATSGASGVT